MFRARKERYVKVSDNIDIVDFGHGTNNRVPAKNGSEQISKASLSNHTKRFKVMDCRLDDVRALLDACFSLGENAPRYEIGRDRWFVGMQVVTMTHELLKGFDSQDMATLKFNGTRFLLVATPRFCALVSRREEVSFLGQKACSGILGSVRRTLGVDWSFVLDVEVMRLRKEGTGDREVILVILDGLYLENSPLAHLPLEERILCVNKYFEDDVAIDPTRWVGFENAEASDITTTRLVQKRHFVVGARHTLEEIRELMHVCTPGAFDGMILEKRRGLYFPGTSSVLLKWKERITVDFRLALRRDNPQSRLVEVEFRVLDDHQPLFDRLTVDLGPHDTQRAREFLALEGRVVECAWNSFAGCWRCLHERKDKNHPNSRSSAEDNVRSIRSRLDFDEVVRRLRHPEASS